MAGRLSPAPEPLSAAALAGAVLVQYPDGPDLVIGHSLGTITAMSIMERHRGWSRTVILEEPPSGLVPGRSRELARVVAGSVRDDAAAVRRDRHALERRVRADCPAWRTTTCIGRWRDRIAARDDRPATGR